MCAPRYADLNLCIEVILGEDTAKLPNCSECLRYLNIDCGFWDRVVVLGFVKDFAAQFYTRIANPNLRTLNERSYLCFCEFAERATLGFLGDLHATPNTVLSGPLTATTGAVAKGGSSQSVRSNYSLGGGCMSNQLG